MSFPPMRGGYGFDGPGRGFGFGRHHRFDDFPGRGPRWARDEDCGPRFRQPNVLGGILGSLMGGMGGYGYSPYSSYAPSPYGYSPMYVRVPRRLAGLRAALWGVRTLLGG
jgi:hypothetical protein